MAGKYTPSTAEVCRRYVSTRDDVWGFKGDRAFRAEFNRWLKDHDAKVAAKAVDAYDKALNDMQAAFEELD